ncbi:MAG: hypothetical protein Kow00127_05290 [Bacteroidales bacterium]
MLENNMFLIMDLHSQNGKLSGYYHYRMAIPGRKGGYVYGKLIPVEGEKVKNTIHFREVTNPDSRFTATMTGEDSLTGFWKRKTYQNDIHFSLYPDYNQGSVPMRCISSSSRERVVQEGVSTNKMPAATFECHLLWPAGGPPMLQEQLGSILFDFLLDSLGALPQPPETIVGLTARDYFDRYHRLTEGIPNIEGLSSFNWTKKITSEVIFNHYNVLSLRFSKYAYTGGAHGIEISRFVCFNIKNGKQLKISDLVPADSLINLWKLAEHKLRQTNNISSHVKLSQAGFLVDHLPETDNFYLTSNGIHLYYNVYQIAPFSTGPVEIILEWDKIKELLKPGTLADVFFRR